MSKFVSEWEMEHSVGAPEPLPDYSISVRKATKWPPNCNLRRHQTHKELPVLASLGGVLFQFSEWWENSCPLFTYSAGALQINFNRQCASLVLQNSVAKLGGMIIRSGINWFSFEGSKVILTQSVTSKVKVLVAKYTYHSRLNGCTIRTNCLRYLNLNLNLSLLSNKGRGWS